MGIASTGRRRCSSIKPGRGAPGDGAPGDRALASIGARLALLGLLVAGCSRRNVDRPAITDAPDQQPAVVIGLERLASAEAGVLEGKRLGLIVHSASRTHEGRHAVDVVRDRGLDVVRLFSPEHGLRGSVAAGATVADGRDPETGLEVVSLYGERKKPNASDLVGIDVLVFDLQGAGVRFYTYVSTMILSLEAAAEAGIEFVVLDRPNPLGGVRIEGPVRASAKQVPESFVSLAPGPLIHGLTLGEMARYVNAHRTVPARLSVVQMMGWQREMTWAATGRPWFPPSPNLRTAEAAIAYPGVALLESTMVSEGRGTSDPFLIFGAPWLDTDLALDAVAGFDLEATRFTPRSSSAAPRPKHLDQLCTGYRVRVVDPAIAEPYRFGINLLTALTGLPDFEWRRDGEALVWLLGTRAVLDAIRAGLEPEEIIALDEASIRQWRQLRRSALLY